MPRFCRLLFAARRRAGVPVDERGALVISGWRRLRRWCFVVENKLGFGVAASSNICQRLADSLLRAFRKILDARESRVHDDILEQEPESPLAQWIRTRRSLGKHQCRRYEISQFTDDPMLVAVSAPVLTSSLALFVQMMKTIGLELSTPKISGGEERSVVGAGLAAVGRNVVGANKQKVTSHRRDHRHRARATNLVYVIPQQRQLSDLPSGRTSKAQTSPTCTQFSTRFPPLSARAPHLPTTSTSATAWSRS